jgi:hypothetical protein
MKLHLRIFFIVFISFLGAKDAMAQSGCNTNITICDNGSLAGPFNFASASNNPSSCLDFTNGSVAPTYAYIVL